ncbi:MAG: prolyl oligopeptidase family serine peptidase, partial [Luteitalea sp.]|nr:prolyl oligopeptidase family serine peptidase [Luteitalea sp.]
GTRVAFTRESDLWVRSLADGRETRLTTSAAAESSPVWSPDDQRLAFLVRVSERQSEAPAYSGAKLVFARFDRQPPDVGIVSVNGGPPSMAASPGWEGAPHWLDPSRLLLQRVTENLKTREVVVAEAETGRTETLHRDVDEKWWSVTYLSPEPIPSPDGRRIAFISDRDGWDHLYVMSSGGGPPVQVTQGQYEISRIAWSPDGTRVAFDTNEGGHPGTRHIAVAALGDDPSAATITQLTDGRGTNTEPRWSPDGTRLLYQHTDPSNSADLYVVAANDTGAPPVRLSSSMPASIARDGLVEPELVRYRAPDGQQVPAYLFVSSRLDRSHRHPAIVWVHGDGVTQSYDGWHVRRDYAVYYSFHQYLAQQGYVVLAVDYRGSIGYGKAWRQGHFRDLGGKDYEDVAAGVDYLRSLGYVDVGRIGIWGLSYGGFMTLQALTVTPELFKCGINVAGVVDWRDWYKDPDGPWIEGRMGPPSQNAALYERTAPIERIDRIVRPLMVLHGTADVNVPFLESVRLIDVATKLDKDVELMMYPGEFHYFHREHVLRDAWQRVARFFDQHLAED